MATRLKMELANALSYEAFQMGSEVVVIAHNIRGAKKNIASLVPAVSSSKVDRTSKVFSLTQEPSAFPMSISPRQHMITYRAFRCPTVVKAVQIHDSTGVKKIAVVQKQEGIDKGGMELRLPMVRASTEIDEVIERMRAADVRAVVVAYSGTDFRLFFNYEIAKAYVEEKHLSQLRGQGHLVSKVKSLRTSTGRTHLFSMEPPLNRSVVRIYSLFESVGGSVAEASKVCTCTGKEASHSRRDAIPSLHMTPCPKAPKGHGNLKCF